MLNYKRYDLKTGYILDSIFQEINALDDLNKKDKFKGLLDELSCFSIHSNIEFNNSLKDNPELYVLHNQLTRGFPTLIPESLEKKFSECFDITREEQAGSIRYKIQSFQDKLNLFLEALHIIDPRLNRTSIYNEYLTSWEEHGSRYEEEFLYKTIPENVDNGNGDWLIQLITPQRSISSMITVSVSSEKIGNEFFEQRTDFSIEWPYDLFENKERGICIEIDGTQHNEPNQIKLDKKRDIALKDSNWIKTFRIPTSAFHDNSIHHFLKIFYRLLNYPYFNSIRKNYNNPLYTHEQGMNTLELMLSPFGIARIQLVLIRTILSGQLSLDQDIWRLAILERDVPCAQFAVDNFITSFKHIFGLQGKTLQIPDIELTIYTSHEFRNAKLRTSNSRDLSELSEDDQLYDLLIDISILERIGLTRKPIELRYNYFIEIRSAGYKHDNHRFFTGSNINYDAILIDTQPIIEKESSLTYFLINLFRKKKFRTGQLEILNMALQNKTVIGLLPTGGGKSLTYQLASLLQPGIVLIVDPIKSLMKDQVDGLSRLGISSSISINSSLKTFEERNQAMSKLNEGKVLFCFISPERMMIESFRNILLNMPSNGLYFSYGVIDEVHCVSEWGHDFRTAYLSLGRNMIAFCQAKEGNIALFGLTATASFDVLSDVQRELSGNILENFISDESVIRNPNTNRNEIQYLVQNVDLNDKDIEDATKQRDYFELELKKRLGKSKQIRVIELLNDAPNLIRNFSENPDSVVTEDLLNLTYENNPPTPNLVMEDIIPVYNLMNNFWNESGENAGLIFTPHRSWYFGVTDKYSSNNQHLNGMFDRIVEASISGITPCYFMGVDSEDEKESEVREKINIKNQEDFINGKANLMVATKAFGMGIDKPNVRLTFHLTYPGSIESFIQEAGRAGRDRQLALSIILFNEQAIPYPNDSGNILEIDNDIQTSFYNNSFKGEEKEKRILLELLNFISCPKIPQVEIFTKRLNESVDSELYKLKYNNNCLFLNDVENTRHGFLKFENNILTDDAIKIFKDAPEPSLSRSLLQKLLQLINEQFTVSDSNNLREWISENHDSTYIDGIETTLNKLNEGEEFEIIIPFKNDKEVIAKKILQIFQSLQIEIDLKICLKGFHHDLDQFISNLSKGTGNKNLKQALDQYDSQKQQIQTQLYKTRDKADTEKALYRLNIIGVINDYMVDYNAETYTVIGVKRTDKEYHKYLRNYISKYYSERRTEQAILELRNRKGQTEIQRILNFIIDFIYREVAKKRREAIESMKQCCRVGLNHGNIEMKQFIHLYFNSKYAKPDYTVDLNEEECTPFKIITGGQKKFGVYGASLLKLTNEGREEIFDLIIEFVRLMEVDRNNSQRDNLKHLRGACLRILNSSPDNFTLRLLKAYAVLLLQEGNLSKKTIEEIQGDLQIGFKSLRNYLDNDSLEFQDKLESYRITMFENIQNTETKDWFNKQLIFIQFLHHTEWTNKFVNKFTTDLQLI